MKRAELRDQVAEQQLMQDGFIVIRNFLPPEEVKVLYELYKKYHAKADMDKGMWNSLYDVSADEGFAISQEILRVLKPRLESIFLSYHAPVATFMSKNCNDKSTCDLHRDFSTQDEVEFQYRNIWIPLVFTRQNNGALFALRRSNQVFDYILPMFTEWPYKSMHEELFAMSEQILADPGDLVIYLDKTLHGSMVNYSDDSRPVVHFGVLHPENRLCFYYLNEATKHVKVYEVPFRFFFENNFGDPGDKYPLVREFSYEPPALDIDAVKEKLHLLAGNAAIIENVIK
jgi:Phytanoyl-CoA dioxygenase (PhyH)